MTETQTLEGAVALLREWLDAEWMVTPDWSGSTEREEFKAKTHAFLALPSPEDSAGRDGQDAWSSELRQLDWLRKTLRDVGVDAEHAHAITEATAHDIVQRYALATPAPAPPADALWDRLLALLMQDKSPPLPNGIVLIQHYFAGTAVKLHEEGTTCVICAALSTSEEGAR
jgi:hypothetical protein